MSASRQTRGRLNMQPPGLNIYAPQPCTENTHAACSVRQAVAACEPRGAAAELWCSGNALVPRMSGGCVDCHLSWRLFIAFVQFRAAQVVRRGSLGSLPGGPRARARLPDVAGVLAARPAMLPARSATR
jgi:hypothetical protein